MKTGTRLAQAVAALFFKSLSRPLTCPLKAGMYKFTNLSVGRIQVPSGIPFPNFEGKYVLMIFAMNADKILYVAEVKSEIQLNNGKKSKGR